LANRPDEARRRLNHLQKSAGSTVGEALGWFYPSFSAPLADLSDRLAEMRANQDELQQGGNQCCSRAEPILMDQRDSDSAGS
jgi:hypothetical protein